MSNNDHEAETFMERLVFNNRLMVVALFTIITIVLGYQASQIRPDTSFAKMIPLQHPYIVNMVEHQDDLANLGNSIRIAVAIEDGDIFSTEYMETLKRINDEVFFLPGVDRSGLRSLWTPNVRWTEVTEYGFDGGPVAGHPAYLDEQSLDDLRINVLKSGEIGRLVANNFKSSIIEVPLQEFYPNPENQSELLRMDYGKFSLLLEEKIRDQFQEENPNISIHMVGFAKKVGDLIEGLSAVVMFFGVALLITFVLLYWFTWCLRSTISVLMTTLIAVVWQLGLIYSLGFGLDPYSMLVPFLIFAIGISHGVQKINGIALQSGEADNALIAARRTFRQLFVPGMIAILADAVGFITLLVIDIGVIHELAIGASVGVGVIVFTNLIMLPVTISYLGISKKAIERSKRDAVREHPFWR
ncbi:MAG: putative RND superfamily exporter protein, partial [Halopseudomonas sp.]